MTITQAMTTNELAVVKEAWLEVTAAVRQMLPDDDKIICDHVKRAEGLLRALVLIQKDRLQTAGNQKNTEVETT